tara:strand:- start:131 stop:340 length:210 start_codon:yes stop_codon:yes gene_type:complete
MGTRPLLKTIGLRFENLKLIAEMKAKIITKISNISDITTDLLSLSVEINFLRLIPADIKKRVKAPKVDE